MAPEVGTVESVATTTTPVVTEKAPEAKAKKPAAKNPAPKAKPEIKKAPAKGKTAPKVDTKKSPTKSKKAPTEEKKERPDRHTADLPVGDRRKAAITALRKLGATSGPAARSIREVAEALGYTHFDVYHLVGSARFPLVGEGFVKLAKVEGQKGNSVYLTAKGLKTDFSKPPFVREEK